MGNLPVTESRVTEGEGSPTVDMVWVDTVWRQCGQERGEPQCGYAAHGVIQVGADNPGWGGQK